MLTGGLGTSLLASWLLSAPLGPSGGCRMPPSPNRRHQKLIRREAVSSDQHVRDADARRRGGSGVLSPRSPRRLPPACPTTAQGVGLFGGHLLTGVCGTGRRSVLCCPPVSVTATSSRPRGSPALFGCVSTLGLIPPLPLTLAASVHGKARPLHRRRERPPLTVRHATPAPFRLCLSQRCCWRNTLGCSLPGHLLVFLPLWGCLCHPCLGQAQNICSQIQY